MKETCNVTNRSAGLVIYSIPDMHIRRSFNRHETKRNISVKELEMLVSQQGGPELLMGYLTLDDDEILQYLVNRKPEPEYYIKEADIPKWMVECTLDEFKDALDFAPQGTKDLIKKFAVDNKLNDHSKREAIKEQLGFDVTKILEITEEDPKEETKTAPARRVAKEEEKPVRRTVVTEKE